MMRRDGDGEPSARRRVRFVKGWFRPVLPVIAFLLVIGAAIGVAVAQEQATPAPGVPPSGSAIGLYHGPASCAFSGCHGSPAPVEGSTILMNEYDTWLHAPAPTHVQAWEVLLSPLSKRIARNLRLTDPPESSPACTGCHATVVPEELQARAGAVEISDGVSCESCHGPAGGWLAEHVQEGWAHEDSVAAGMIDLRHLPTRARLCLGCHMGDGTRQVTHDTIAAGHPILVFELDNFTNSNLLPRHWKPNPRHGVRAWAVGQIVALREETENLARHARGPEWPEFSHMSCASCHHPLREGVWRQERGFEHRPGMPLWSTDRWVVSRHVVEMAAPDELAALTREIRELSGEVGRMRDRERIASLAATIAARLDRITPVVETRSWSDAEVRMLIRRIAADAERYSIADRQSAEQATLSMITLVSELGRGRRVSVTRAVDDLYRILERLEHPDEYDRLSFASTLRELQID
jgi:hypothetical protein